ncbi:MAG: BatD family protein [Kangiellaceae bacterium]|nr:BatD family protein [Kangiellaceae bacterium]MCW8999545.1 BatD family protein [Kangiellaceae bacterium]
MHFKTISKNFGLSFCLALFFTLASPFLLAKVTQSIDRNDISAGETFVLDIQIDEDTSIQPDLSLIPADFTIVSSSQYQHTQIINGRRSSIKGWKIKLKTLKTGPITIPAITVGNEETRPIKLNIKDSSNELDLNGEDKAIYLEATVDQEEAFVQQQIIYTISLYRSVNTHYASLTEPTAENSIIEKLGDDVQFEKVISGRRYIVTQRKYAIFPQQSGELEIGQVNFTADVNDNSRRQRSLFLNSTRPVSISTKSKKIKVNPKPANAPTPWLPATNVILADKWTPNTQELTVGEPITWTLLLSVQGLSESQLPEIQLPKIDGLQLYPDTPQKERQLDKNGVMGQRVEKYAVIPSKAGTITIPEIELDWWDTKTNQKQTATLPAKTFSVVASAKVEQPVTPIPQIEQPVQTTTIVDETAVKQWQMIAAGLGVLWLFTLIAYFTKPKVKIQQPAKDTENSSSKPSLTQQQAKSQALDALKSGSQTQIEQSLISLAQAYNRQDIHSLGAIINLVNDDGLKEKLNSIEASRYSATQHSSIATLDKHDIDLIISELISQRNNKPSSGIPPLYA